jgi:ankyrin repeat protein
MEKRYRESKPTPLHLAANRGSLDTVKCLLRGGADIDAQDSDSDTPAMVALLC